MERIKIEFRTLRSSSKTNTGNIIIATQSNSGDIIFEMAKLKAFNQSGKPTFDYDNKTVFGLGDMEMGKICLSMQRFLSNPTGFTSYYPEAIVFQHHTAAKPKNISFTFSTRENKKGKLEGQLQVSVYHLNDKTNYNIYLNEEEIYCLKAVMDAQLNPSLKRIAVQYGEEFKLFEKLEQYMENGYAFRNFIANK